MPDGRKRIASMLGAGVLATGLALQPFHSAFAEPRIDTVKQRVATLYHEAEQANERYNQVRDAMDASRVRLRALNADVDRQRRIVGAMREQVRQVAVEQYQEGTLSTASKVVFSDDPGSFIDNLNAVSSYNEQRDAVMAEYAVGLERLKLRQQAADEQVAQLRKQKRARAAQKAETHRKAARAKNLLTRLKAEQRARVEAAAAASHGGSSAAPAAPAPTAAAASGRAGAAVSYALAQVGDAYVYGAAGPDAFDCSGLTMAAWAQAGVSLPHSSTAQMGSGASVSSSALQPGDLVFYYSPVSHVGIYIGNGQIVHAANPSTGVQVAPVFSMPVSGAVRPG